MTGIFKVLPKEHITPLETKREITSMRDLLVDLASQSNVHGISCLVSKKATIVKIFWGFAFLGLLGFAIFQLYTIGTIFLSYPVKTKVKMEFKPLPFPAVTICNMNTIRHSKIWDIQNKKLQEILNGTFDFETGANGNPSGQSNLSVLQSGTDYDPSDTGFDPFGTDNDPSDTLPDPFDFWDYFSSKTTQTQYQATPTSGLSATSASTTSSSASSSVASSTTDFLNIDDYYDWGSDLLNDILGFTEDIYLSPFQHDYVVYETFREEYLKIDREEKKKVGHQLKNMLLECQFNGRKCEIPIKDVVTYDYGNCFTIESHRFVSASTGPTNGMVLTVNLENHEAIEGLTEGYGMRMVIHEPRTFPLPLDEGMTISGGYETSIGLKLTRIERKGEPYGTCTDTKDYHQKHGFRYTAQACIQQCWENLAFSTCRCRVGNIQTEISHFGDQDDREVNTTSEKGCFTKEERKCSLDVRRDMLTSIDKYCHCPQPCLENAYITTFSGRIWPHPTKQNELIQQACNTYDEYNTTGMCDLHHWDLARMSTNFLKVHIYFEDLNYEVISEEPLYDATQLISDIGGSLGLCLGASLLCICEIFEAISMIIIVVLRKLRGRNSVSKINLRRPSLVEFKSSKA